MLMDIIHAIRELCRGEHGFENMFDKTKSSGKLGQLTGGDREAELFETLLYGSARETLIEMINGSECREEDETFKNAMDIQFGMLETWLDGQFPSEEEIKLNIGQLLPI